MVEAAKVESPLLSLKRFGVAFGDRVVLANVHLEIAPRGMHVLVGPAGAGKSTLLRTLAGLNESQPSLRVWGAARYADRPLADGARPALVQQNARLLASSVRENIVSNLPDRSTMSVLEQTERVRALLDAHALGSLGRRLSEDVISLGVGEQRLVSIIRGAASGAELLMVDEPTAGVDGPAADAVVAVLRSIAAGRAVLVVTHHRAHALSLGGTAFLLAGGRVVERAPTQTLFASPTTDAGRAYAETGSCPEPAPGATREELAEGIAFPTPIPPAMRRIAPESTGPRGFYWLERGRVGGLPRPGIVADVEQDLAGLTRLGVTVLVTLEERPTVPVDALAAHGIRSVHFPIPDMHAPGIDETAALCARIESMLARGDVVAVHCLAGLGRTGTLLGALLVWRGTSPLEAIETVRAIRPRSIQSADQAEFLVRFAKVRTQRIEPAGNPGSTKAADARPDGRGD